MNNKEAIEWLKSISKKYIHGGDEWYDEQRHEAISLAIKALEERPQGEWKHYSITMSYCSNCKRPYEQSCKNYCCYCGADMRNKETHNDR